MPIPKDLPQDRIVVNGQKATDMGRTPKVLKPWREGVPAAGLIDPVTLKAKETPSDSKE